MKRRLLSFLLCICMVLTMLPATAFAALLDNDPAYNREILAQLREICGSEEEAERYYALLQQYGLLDEDGSAVDSWTVTMDGQEVTLADLRAVLAGDYDPEKLVLVDGTPITLGDLDTVLQIEDYVAYLRETYFSGGEWTQEQLESLRSLQEQINTRGIMMLGVNDEGTIGASGVDHSATVTVATTSSDLTTNGGTVTFTATRTGDTSSEVTFRYKAVSGSASSTSSGTVTIPAGKSSADFSVTVDSYKPTNVSGQTALVVELYDLEGAIFSNGRYAMSLPVTVSGHTGDAVVEKFKEFGTATYEVTYDGTIAKSDNRYIEATDWYSDTNDILYAGYGHCVYSADTTSVQGQVRNYIKSIISQYDGFEEWRGYSAYLSGGLVSVSGSLYDSLYSSDSQAAINSAPSTSRYFEIHEYNLDGDGEDSNKFIARIGWQKDEQGNITEIKGGDIGVRGLETVAFWKLSAGHTVYTMAWHLNNGQLLHEKTNGWSDVSGNDIVVTLGLRLKTDTSISSVSIPNDHYYIGQIIPITATFTKAVHAKNAKLTVNGQTCSAIEDDDTISTTLTFAYEVKEGGNNSLSGTGMSISVSDYADNPVSQDVSTLVSGTAFLNPMDIRYAVDTLTADKTAYNVTDTAAVITMTPKTNPDYKTEFSQNGYTVYLSADGGTTLREMTQQESGAYICTLPLYGEHRRDRQGHPRGAVLRHG